MLEEDNGIIMRFEMSFGFPRFDRAGSCDKMSVGSRKHQISHMFNIDFLSKDIQGACLAEGPWRR